MSSIIRDFVSDERREFKYHMGTLLASALSGFVAGIIVASFIWGLAFWYRSQVRSAADLIQQSGSHTVNGAVGNENPSINK